MEMSADNLSWAAGAALSLIFSYWPGLRERYGALDGTQKRLVMLALLVLVSLAVFGLSCAGWTEGLGFLPLSCSQSGLLGLARIFVQALWANQSTFLLSPAHITIRTPLLARDGSDIQ